MRLMPADRGTQLVNQFMSNVFNNESETVHLSTYRPPSKHKSMCDGVFHEQQADVETKYSSRTARKLLRHYSLYAIRQDNNFLYLRSIME